MGGDEEGWGTPWGIGMLGCSGASTWSTLLPARSQRKWGNDDEGEGEECGEQGKHTPFPSRFL